MQEQSQSAIKVCVSDGKDPLLPASVWLKTKFPQEQQE